MKRFFFFLLILLILVGGAVAYFGYTHIYQPVVQEDLTIQIPTNSEYEAVLQLLSENDLVRNEQVFRKLAERMNYIKSPMRSGQYELKKGQGTYEMIRQLRSGEQKPSNMVVNINWTYERAAARLAEFVEIDSFNLVNTINDSQLQEELAYNSATAMTLFIPNTYEVYWNTSGADVVRRLNREKQAFWNKADRIAKAEKLEMTPDEVYTLASIVERETNQNEEKQRMAGVYINRLRKGIPLQADPTVKFGIGDLSLKRILNKHLAYDSPYNTYIYPGLPPGPISMASISSIDAVLNAEQHNYIYFCRRPDETGLHEFARTLKQHNVNAAKYHRWYNQNFN